MAVLAVLGYHFQVPGFQGGFLGVDMFFVVSGYLITSQLLRAETLDMASLAAFYARRARRILPLATAVLLVSALAVRVALGTDRLHDLATDVIASAVFVGNLPAAAAGEYLAGVALPSPFRHFWSLAVEEQFYLFWPALALWLSHAFYGRSRRSVLRTAALGVCLVSFAFSVLRSGSDPAGSYFLPHTRAWEIALGALAATFPARSRIVGWFAIPMLAAGFAVLDATSVYPGYLALLPTLATVLLLLATSPDAGLGRLLAFSPLRSIGALSFGLYLWHWPVLTIATERFGYLNWAEKGAALSATVLLSVGSYWLLENPLRYSSNLRASTRKSLTLLPISLVIATVFPAVSLVFPPQQEVLRAQQAPPPAAQLPPPTTPDGQTSTPTSPVLSPEPLPSARSVLLVGDSTLAPLRWFVGASASLQGFSYVLDAESCRKLANRSCSGGREGRTPPSAAAAISSAKLHDVLFVMAGYHSYPDTIASEFRAVVRAARDRGFTSIVWMTLRESTHYPGVGNDVSVYATFNRSVRSVIAEGGYEDVVVLDWNAYSASRLDWFVPDGIHVNLRGALALGEYVSLAMAALDGRPCPGASLRVPCVLPLSAPSTDDLLGRYGLVDTIEHCYEMGESRQLECRPDKEQVD